MGLTSRSTIVAEIVLSTPFDSSVLRSHSGLTLPPACKTRLEAVPPHSSLLGCRTARTEDVPCDETRGVLNQTVDLKCTRIGIGSISTVSLHDLRRFMTV
jgi:hypothetical protein